MASGVWQISYIDISNNNEVCDLKFFEAPEVSDELNSDAVASFMFQTRI